MIGVIADDLTGAAELGGVGFRFGLESEIHTRLGMESSAKLIAFDTDSRLCPENESVRRVVSTAEYVQSLGPEFVYKKVDSALRGRIIAEIEALMDRLGKRRALLIPANPSLHRVIEGGRYFINGVPIDQTGFRNDPEFPCRTSNVVDLLRTEGRCAPFVCKHNEPIPERGIIIGEVSSRSDLHAWAARLDDTIFAAGAAEFFTVIVETRGLRAVRCHRNSDLRSLDNSNESSELTTGRPGAFELFVCGSASDAAERFLKDARECGIGVFSMPPELADNSCENRASSEAKWLEETLNCLVESNRAVVAIDCPLIPEANRSEELLTGLIEHVERMLAKMPVDSVFADRNLLFHRCARRYRSVGITTRKKAPTEKSSSHAV